LASEDRPEQLVISLEPEAASVFVRRQHLHQLVRGDELQEMGLGRPRSPRPGRISVSHRAAVPTDEHVAVQSGATLISCDEYLRPHSIMLCWSQGGAVVQRVQRLEFADRGFKSYSRQRCVTTLDKLFTPMCLCHQAV